MNFWLDDTINTFVVHIVQSKLFDFDQIVTSVLTVSFDLKKTRFTNVAPKNQTRSLMGTQTH